MAPSPCMFQVNATYTQTYPQNLEKQLLHRETSDRGACLLQGACQLLYSSTQNYSRFNLIP